MPGSADLRTQFVQLTDEQLRDLESRFGRIYEHTPPAPKRSRWAAPGSPDPPPPFQVVFRACSPGEWDNIMGQTTDDRLKAGAVKTMAKGTIVAVSFAGEVVIHEGDANDRAAAKPVRAAFDRLIREWPGVPQAVADDLAELNGVVKAEAEK